LKKAVLVENYFINVCHSERVEKTKEDTYHLAADATIPIVIEDEKISVEGEHSEEFGHL
jgi:hypothetical protein